MSSIEETFPLKFRDEIIECLIENSNIITGDSYEGKRKNAEEYLNDSFFISGGDYKNPDYESLLKVLKILATKELKTGKDREVIAGNFLRIARKIKSAQQQEG